MRAYLLMVAVTLAALLAVRVVADQPSELLARGAGPGVVRSGDWQAAPVACRPPKGVVCQRPPRNDHERVRRTMNSLGWGWAWRTAERIIRCESDWRPGELYLDTNGRYSRGLWQINDVWSWLWTKYGWAWASPQDNTRAAYEVYKAQGFGAWSCA